MVNRVTLKKYVIVGGRGFIVFSDKNQTVHFIFNSTTQTLLLSTLVVVTSCLSVAKLAAMSMTKDFQSLIYF